MKKFFAELIGTFILVFVGTGTVAFGNGMEGIGHVGIALAFGLSIVAAAYSIGTISGAHLNPAVSIAMFVNKRLNAKDLASYIVAQVVGALLASSFLYFLVSNSGLSVDKVGLGQNALADGVTALGGFLFEAVASFIFILVIVTVTSESKGNVEPRLLASLSVSLWRWWFLSASTSQDFRSTQLVAWHHPSLLVALLLSKFGSLSWHQSSVVSWLLSLVINCWKLKNKWSPKQLLSRLEIRTISGLFWCSAKKSGACP